MPTSKFCIEQREKERQKLKKTLALGFVSSVLFHGLLALTFAKVRSRSSDQTEKPIELIIVEQPQIKSPEIASTPQPKPESKSALQPTPSSTAKPPLRTSQPNPAPKPVTPPAKIEQSQPKIEPPPPKVPTPQASQKPDLSLPTKTPVSPKIAPQPQKNPDVEPKLIDTNQAKQSENLQLATVSRPESDRSLEKPVIAPKQPETSFAETNSAVNPNSDRESNSSQPESSQIARNSSTQGNSENRSAERHSEGENNSSTTENNNSTAANTISDKLKKPLSISCQKNCRPKYPSALGGAEGRAGIQLTIDANGNVINAAIAESNGNPKLDREALKAARRMKFSSINRDRATVRINISFTVAGSDFERQARREQRERQEQEGIEQLETEKQAELERERQP